MKRRIYSLALVLCMLIGMFPMQAFASGDDSVTTAHSYAELVEALANTKIKTLYISNEGDTPFGWPSGECTLNLTSSHISSVLILSDWVIPENVTVNHTNVKLTSQGNSLTINGTWNIVSDGEYMVDGIAGYSCETTVNGTVKVPQGYRGMVAKKLVLNGTLEIATGSTVNLYDATFGDGAKIETIRDLDSPYGMANVELAGGYSDECNGIISCPEGEATIDAILKPSYAKKNNVTIVPVLDGNFDVSEIRLNNDYELIIAEDSYVKVNELAGGSSANKTPNIIVKGTLEVDADSEYSETHFTNNGTVTVEKGGELIVRAYNAIGRDTSTTKLLGEGTVKLYSRVNMNTNKPTGSPAKLYGWYWSQDPRPSQVAETLTIWRNWEDCEHKWSEEFEIIREPSCDGWGQKIHICEICGTEGSSTEGLEPTGKHTGGTATCEKQAVCESCGEPYGELAGHTSSGVTDCTQADTCSVCGEVIRPAGEHAWDDGEVTKAATCTEDGEITYTCSCNATYTETIKAPGSHNWSTNDCTEKAHCTNDGCNETREAGQHSWGEWTETKAPDCENLGEKAHTCQNTACGKTETEFVDMLGHDWDSIVVQPTCTEGGYKINFCKRDNCGHSYNSDVKASLGHAWDEGVVTKEPTATEDGVKTYSCTREGCNATKTEAISKLPKQNIGWDTQWADPSISANVSYTYGDASTYTNAAWNESVEDCVFTYASSDETVATVDEDGKVTIIGAGECEITATAPAVDGEFAETTIGYHLSVLKKPITVKANDHAIVYSEAPANNGWTSDGLIEGDTLTGTAVYTYNYEQYGKAGGYEISLSGLVNDNYDITFVKGTLTVNKASEYALTLSDLSQYVGDITGAKVNIAPQDTTAQFKVEYEMVTAAVPCGHKHDDACGGEAECNHVHNEACGYKAEVRTWTETAPTVKGEYNVRASLLSSDNITVNAENIATGTFEVKTRASIGGGGSAPSGGNGGSLDVESGNKDVSVEVEVKDGTVEVIVTENDLDKIIENIPETGEVVVDLTSVDNAKELVIPGELVSALDKNEDAKQLTIVSESAEIVMDENVMGTLAETIKSENDKVSVELTGVKAEDLSKEQQAVVNSIAANPVIVELNLVVNHYDENGSKTGETKLHELGGDVEVAVEYKLPAGMEGRNVVAAYINDEGHVQYMRAKYIDGKVVFTTDHFSVYVVTAMKAAIFKDIDLNGWYTPSVEWAVINGITEGTGETTFAPDMVCTRAQAVTFLYRAAGSPAVKGDMPFADVAENAYYYNAVLWAVNNGITKGVSETEFAPDEVCTREQIVTFLYRTAVSLGKDVSVGEDTNILSYDDAFDIGEWAIPAMQWAVGEGVMTGTSESTLSQKMECTRAQIVTFLARAFGE